MSWKEHGSCVDMDINLFFPLPGPRLYAQVQTAKRICADCPVQQDCLDYAMEFVKGRYITLPGIYGGTTEQERWKLARQSVINRQ